MTGRKNMFHKSLVSTLIIGMAVVGCGGDKKHSNRRSKDATIVEPFNPENHYFVRGRWEIPINFGESKIANLDRGMSFFGTENHSTSMTATIAAAVTFTVEGTNFQAPANPEDIASYGTLDVTDLRDNSMRECGIDGRTRCTTGAIRVYTTGTSGSGLWNDVEQYGLPITSGTNSVGLEPTNAFIAATANIGRINVLKLSHFNVGANLQIPIAVDFSDAAAGSYATTLIVEYVIQ